MYIWFFVFIRAHMPLPRVGSRVVRIDQLRFLAGRCTRRLNQATSVLYFSTLYSVLSFIRAPFYVVLVFCVMCSAFWLFWLICEYLPSNWLERPPLRKPNRSEWIISRKPRLKSAYYFLGFFCFIVFYVSCVVSRPYVICFLLVWHDKAYLC